jgi:hypothetical protein
VLLGLPGVWTGEPAAALPWRLEPPVPGPGVRVPEGLVTPPVLVDWELAPGLGELAEEALELAVVGLAWPGLEAASVTPRV